MLTNAAVRSARPKAAGYKLPDGGGLHLFVAPNGRRSFRMRFPWQGKEQLLTFGMWPEVSLDEARGRRDAARAQLARGEDPRAAQVCAISQTHDFEHVARQWHALTRPRWTEVHAVDVLASLERDIFPAIGAAAIREITPPMVVQALRAIERRGRLETARRVRQRISLVFEYAIAEGLADSDPAERIGSAMLPPAPARRQPAIVEIGEARALLAAVDALDAARPVKLASRFLALTAVRLAALRGARWEEIGDLDGDNPTWRVPAARMKLAAAKKLDAANDHLVPLSAQAVQLLRAASLNMHRHDANMHPAGVNMPTGLIFPGDGPDTPIGEGAIGAL